MRCFCFGLPERIRTFGLQSRSLTRYPAVPRADTMLLYINFTNNTTQKSKILSCISAPTSYFLFTVRVIPIIINITETSTYELTECEFTTALYTIDAIGAA